MRNTTISTITAIILIIASGEALANKLEQASATIRLVVQLNPQQTQGTLHPIAGSRSAGCATETSYTSSPVPNTCQNQFTSYTWQQSGTARKLVVAPI